MYAPAHISLGAVLFNQGKIEDAIACFRKAIELDPKSTDAQFNLALVLAGQGKRTEAIEVFQQLLQNDPNNEVVQRHLRELKTTQTNEESLDKTGRATSSAVDEDAAGNEDPTEPNTQNQ